MYESFYGLTAKPFQLNPDPDFFFASKEHRRAMAYLEYGVHKSEGFIVVTYQDHWRICQQRCGPEKLRDLRPIHAR